MTDISNPEKLPHFSPSPILDGARTIILTEQEVITKLQERVNQLEARLTNLEGPQTDTAGVRYPSVNWDHVRPDINHIARDGYGDAYGYCDKPELASHAWFSQEEYQPLIMVSSGDGILASYDPGTCDWQDSLISRPGVE